MIYFSWASAFYMFITSFQSSINWPKKSLKTFSISIIKSKNFSIFTIKNILQFWLTIEKSICKELRTFLVPGNQEKILQKFWCIKHFLKIAVECNVKVFNEVNMLSTRKNIFLWIRKYLKHIWRAISTFQYLPGKCRFSLN